MIKEILMERTMLIDILSLNVNKLKQIRDPIPQLSLFLPDCNDIKIHQKEMSNLIPPSVFTLLLIQHLILFLQRYIFLTWKNL